MVWRKAFRNGSVVLLLLALGACRQQPPEPAPLDFDTDPHILRGVWTGETDGVRLLLDLNASQPTAEGYVVTGSFQLGDAEPVVIKGRTDTPLTLPGVPSSQASPPFAAVFTAAAPCRAGIWKGTSRKVHPLNSTCASTTPVTFTLSGSPPKAKPL